jgi:hypothetical protein
MLAWWRRGLAGAYRTPQVIAQCLCGVTLMRRNVGKLRFELLERRHLMAGDVDVVVSSGRLEIDGDRKDNAVEIRQLDADSFEIKGVSTTVNGAASFVANGVTNDFLIKLAKGSDTVRFFSIEVPRHLTVIAGYGDDTVEVNDVQVSGDTEINVGRDRDEIRVNSTNFSGKCEIHFNNGNDKLRFENSTVGAYCEFDSSTGADQMEILGSIFQSLMKIDASSDGDVITIDGNCVFRGDLSFVGKQSGHTFNLLNSTFEGSVNFDTGDGDEQLLVRGSTFKQNFTARLDEGDDTVQLENSRFEAAVSLNGEQHEDTLIYLQLSNTFIAGQPIIANFEHVS